MKKLFNLCSIIGFILMIGAVGSSEIDVINLSTLIGLGGAGIILMYVGLKGSERVENIDK